MTYLLFAVALSLSAVAAYYAIFGLIAIFAAAAIPIAIMGGLLEASKLVVASWLYRNWKEIPKLFKAYFLTALVILMMLTSMGIFGYLSKAHLDQAVPTGNVASEVAILDEKIAIQKENINAARKQISQMDSINDQTISRTDDAKGIERANQIRRSQQKDRTRILDEISSAQKEIAKLNEQKAPIAKDLRKIEAEVGPIKYIAALIYGDNPDSDVLEKAVRVVILMIVAVFDPLAVLLLVAASWNMKNIKPVPKEEPEPIYVADVTMPEPEYDSTELEEFFKRGKEVARRLDGNESLEGNPDVTVEEVPEESTEELLDIQIDEPSKDWEPPLYQRVEEKQMGRWEQEVGAKPAKTESFLKKVQSVYAEPIEIEVDDLQKPK
ncbi:hypothetical protein UFOVP240_97 [uncultured Caudovirales phage]|uniref:DUF4407 domain-containing protein n=1 Tax=uncultured Caudovirales phage TaxID=2100421 RepID=A0A6J7X1L1_9CAUD|nr:hypothetical protein UFOVP240_97 [uncultured Caudovirales phage]